ncbi:flagellar biosynthesis protein FlhB [Sessilibacter corallicola]|uniref:flagellar biosynthesis protein FlhB n=1 Tax=Sessilibacter corallicola TaxID=2904075 RepID=UPI001E3A8F18|nr:flagellar biosynthesis protein FlhB [Sessilibacter corallicola]MCE2029131.1 flagellar biosynthesis protein FlhB [Sessilibacter corallicola]
MAENNDSQEKSEEPTAKRLDKAREEGQVPRSRELTTSAVLLGATLSLYLLGDFFADKISGIFIVNFQFDRATAFDTDQLLVQLGLSIKESFVGLIPIFSVLMVLAFVSPIALGGWLLSAKSLAPKFSRINPLSGLKRMFSMKSVIELLKALGKVAVVMTVAILLLYFHQGEIISLSNEDITYGLAHAIQLMIFAALVLSASTLLIAIIDVPFQIWENKKQLKMSLQEVKDELKDSEGKPEVKNRIRQLQRDLANNRMLSQVPEADVIITNPTHFSVALKYDPETMKTPVIVAKGVDFMAMKIREIANAHDVELVPAPVLTRALYYTTEVDDEVPHGLFLAVAQVLAYIFQLRQYRRGQAKRPICPKHLPIPEEYIFNS